MASVLAIVSKKVFDKDCRGKSPGSIFATDTYASTHKALDTLSDGGSLFLATVRPDAEDLWLVAVLEAPKKGPGGWSAAKNAVPITDISSLRSKIRFTTGTGMTEKAGALAMSLQTPRSLADADVALLRAAAGSAAATPASSAALQTTSVVAKVAATATKRPSATNAASTNATATEDARAARNAASGAPPDVIVFSAEAREHLLPRTSDDLVHLSKRRRELVEKLAASDRLEAEIEGIASLIPAPTTDVTPEDIAAALLLVGAETRARCMALGERLWTERESQRGRLLGCFPHRSDWAKELATKLLEGSGIPWRDVLLSTVLEKDLLVEIVKRGGLASCVINVVPSLREAAADVIDALFEHVRFPNEEKAVARALSSIGTPEAAAVFVKHLRKKNVRPYAIYFFGQFPHLAKGALGELAAKKTQVGEIARTMLANLERAREATAGAAEADVEEASEDEIPALLKDTWAPRKKTKRDPIVVTGLVAPAEPLRLHWSDWARRRHLASHFDSSYVLKREEEIRAFETRVAKNEKAFFHASLPEDVALPLFLDPPGHVHVSDDAVAGMLALYGDRVVPTVVEKYLDRVPSWLRFHLESPRVAAWLAAKDLHQGIRRDSLHWLERYPETAALGLIPAAVGDGPKARAGGEVGLRRLVRAGHTEAIARAAATYGPDAVRAVDEILAADDPEEWPKKPPKMPSTYRPDELRPVRLRSGKVLPRPALEHLDQLLAASPLVHSLVDFAPIRAACDRRSLAERAWDLAKAWDMSGAKDTQIWMLHAIAHVGDDEVVRRSTPALKAAAVLPMLGHIGTDAALMELGTILLRAWRGGKASWQTSGAESAIQLIAARRGLDPEALEEQFVPTCSVDPEDGVVLDLGPRAYRLRFDPQLSRILEDESGARVSALPRGAKGDDPAKLAAAASLLGDLEEDVAAIADQRAQSLERAMLTGRTWSLSPLQSIRPGTSDFNSVWVLHPLMKHMARGVVWEARRRDGRRLVTFRIAEDGSYADSSDDHVELPEETAAIGIAHPARLPREERARWGELFADYEILQPFEQLVREPVVLTAAELARTEIERGGATVAPTSQTRLLRGGWLRYGYAGVILPFEDGVFGVVRPSGTTAKATALRDRRPVPLGEVDDVVRTELVRAAEILVGLR